MGKIVMQAVISFVVLLALTRWIGRQQVSQLTYYEYINGITFGSIAANMATDEFSNFFDHFTGLAVYGVMTVLAAYVSMKSRRARKVIDGEPEAVIRDGELLEENLRKNKVNVDELMMMLRLKDVFDFTQVKLALLEEAGGLSVILKGEEETVKRKDLKIEGEEASLLVGVVADGAGLEKNLARMGLDKEWLDRELAKQGVAANEVMYGAVNEEKVLLLARKGAGA